MSARFPKARVKAALDVATQKLLAEIGQHGFWVGELSSSALSTATSVIALSRLNREQHSTADENLITCGLSWLAAHQNSDGGWGDTDRSFSNISTTALAWAAFGCAGKDSQFEDTVVHAVHWLQNACGSQAQGWESKLKEAIRMRYGKDRTFSVPILTACIISGRLGRDEWKQIPALPFELAALPHSFYGALQLPVVSYALPALIAIGQSIHWYAPTGNPLLRFVRNALRQRTSLKLEAIQPEHGGFLEATPLTSFVLMNLAAIGDTQSQTALRAASFLRDSVRSDGSWPIDTNLSTWVSTWAINGLQKQPGLLRYEQRAILREWLLGQQYRRQHPFTNAAPGGWAWTDLPGGVPDADDTPGALLALLTLGPVESDVRQASKLGTRWLLDLQNRDGGIPTFCRGWGTLPFDRSGADITAHVLRAWSAWLPHWDDVLRKEVGEAIRRGIAFLKKEQRTDGTWAPLWFGNQHVENEENMTWGTARVVLALRELHNRGFVLPPDILQRGEAALVELQQNDGGWSGGFGNGLPSSIEETGVALEALAGTAHTSALERGVQWLVQRVEDGTWTHSSPVGFYFAKLWYYERLYPQLTTVAALGSALQGVAAWAEAQDETAAKDEPADPPKPLSSF